jgi:hypothetical protein
MNSPTRDTARRAFWLASLLVPGWAQLMAGRLSAIAWLAAGFTVWLSVPLCASRGVLPVLGVLALAAALHVASALCAARLKADR